MIRPAKKQLGRTLPSDLQRAIASLGATLDSMMAQSEMLSLMAGIDIRGDISKLNTRLVNEVILVPGQITDEQAKGLLGEIKKDTAALKSQFDQAGVALDARPWAASADTPHAISRKQAEGLAADFNQAFALYPVLVDRYGKLRAVPSLETVLAPVFGPGTAKAADTMGSQLSQIDADLFWQKDAFNRLQVQLDEGTEAVQVDPASYVRMSNWVGDVFKADEGQKRLEGAALQKRAEATLPGRNSPWKTIALASGGLAMMGGILYLAMKA